MNGIQNEETRKVNFTNSITPPILPSQSHLIGNDLSSREGTNGKIYDSYIMSENGSNILSPDEKEDIDGSTTIESEFGTFNIKRQNDDFRDIASNVLMVLTNIIFVYRYKRSGKPRNT